MITLNFLKSRIKRFFLSISTKTLPMFLAYIVTLLWIQYFSLFQAISISEHFIPTALQTYH